MEVKPSDIKRGKTYYLNADCGRVGCCGKPVRYAGKKPCGIRGRNWSYVLVKDDDGIIYGLSPSSWVYDEPLE